MIKKFALALAATGMSVGMIMAGSISADASPAPASAASSSATKTCDQRGYTKIVFTKYVRKGGKAYATAYVKENLSKKLDYCLDARNRAGTKRIIRLAVSDNDLRVHTTLHSDTSGATGSIAFHPNYMSQQSASIRNVGRVNFYF